MSRQGIRVIIPALALLLAACSKPAGDSGVEEQSAGAQEPAAASMPEPETTPAAMTDPTVADPDHYAVEFENDAVRVLRINYGAGEASVMHFHPDGVAVFLTDHLVEMEQPDGSVRELSAAAGDAAFVPGGQHLPRNVADDPVEVVLIELK